MHISREKESKLRENIDYAKELDWLIFLYRKELVTTGEYLKIKEKINEKYQLVKER